MLHCLSFPVERIVSIAGERGLVTAKDGAGCGCLTELRKDARSAQGGGF